MLNLGLTEVLGVELHHLGDSNYSVRYIKLQRKGSELEISKKNVLQGTLIHVLTKIPKKLPVALVVSGKGILHKTLTDSGQSGDSDLFRQAFPAIDPKDFYLQKYVNANQSCLSIARINFIEQLISKFTGSGFDLFSISFGGILAVTIWPQLNSYGDEIIFDGHHFQLQNRQFYAYQFERNMKADFPIKVGEEHIDEELLLAYSAAFQLLLNEKIQIVVANIPTLQRLPQFLTASVWKKRIIIFLMAVFILLLLSFITFTHFNSENEKLLKQVGTQTSTAEQIELLKKQIIEQERLLKDLEWNGGYSYANLISEIGSSMPSAISLTGIVTNNYKVEQNKFENIANITVSGVTKNLTALNNWIFILRDKKWVKGAKLLSFQEIEKEIYKFDILINY